MFDHRLGLALGKSISEIRALPADEVETWKTFYKLEPWGWHDREYRLSAILAQIWNVNVTKRHLARRETDYYRNMYGLYMQATSQEQADAEMRNKLLEANIEERKQMIAQAFCAMGIKTKEV